jgi:hypothetical protein
VSHMTWAMPFVRITLGIVLLVSAMLYPFLPGRHDPFALSLSACATGIAFVGLLLVPIGAAWAISGRAPTMAKLALAVASLVAAGGALAMAANASLAGGAIVLTAALAWLVYLWRRVRAAPTNGATLGRRAIPVALILVPLAATTARLVLVPSVAAWIRDRAIANATTIIADIEQFRERNGTYPAAISSVMPDYHPGIIGIERYRYEPNGDAYNLYFELPAIDLAVHEIVMFNPRGEQDISSHAADLLQLTPDEIRRQRGYFASHELPQARWKQFLFD